MNSVVVREAGVRDADEIGLVHVLAWQEAYRGQIPDDYLDALSIDRRQEAWRRLLAAARRDETNWVAVVGSIVGFAGAGATRDADGESRGELFAIYVRASHWGTGIGAELMATATAWLRERYNAATLWVLASNVRARRFYEKSGWRFDGAIKDDDRGSFVLKEVRYRIDF